MPRVLILTAAGAEYVLAYTAGRKRVIFRDVFPNAGDDVLGRLGMKGKAPLSAH